MKIHTTDAQVWWIPLADEIRPVRGIDIKEIAAGLQSIFNFQSPPTEKGGGIEFSNGRLAGPKTVLVTKLAIYNDGLNAQVPTDTDDAEAVLQSALAFVFDIGVRRPVSRPLHFYQSTIVADFESPLEAILPNPLLRKISKAMPFAGDSHLLNIATNFDASAIADPRWRGINPTLFRVDRRASVPYEFNRYFCVANMTSSDHIDILEEFEKFASTLRR
jgi:hypothetical protein